MTPEQMDEARRWVALRGWRWMPGMLAVRVRDRYYDPPDAGTRIGRMYRVLHAGPLVIDCYGESFEVTKSADYAPDVTDPATRGCLLALAREITGRPRMWIEHWRNLDVWCCVWQAPGGHPCGPRAQTEAGALLAACEAHERGAEP